MSAAGRKQPTAVSRMKRDYMRLKRDPLPYITAEPLPNNILEWHYVVKGPEDSPYYGGYYHGTLHFPREFPFKPPSIYMLTPSGRFRTNTRLCLSISDFHPDTWNPTWCVGTILTGLLSFMLETTPTQGSIETTTFQKQQYAQKSLEFNMKNQQFCELFPEICEEIKQRLQSLNPPQAANGTAAAGEANAAKAPASQSATANGTANDAKALTQNNRFFNLNTLVNWQSLYSNLVIIISAAIFALVVNHVIKNLNQE